MANYRNAVNARTGVNTANTVLFQLRAPSTARIRVHEIVWTVASAPTNAPQLVIARSSTLGTATTSVAGQPTDAGDPASSGLLESAWSSSPTFSTTGPFLFAVTIPSTAGSTFYWAASTDAEHLVLDVSTGIVFAAANASGNSTGSHSLQIAYED